ncbi:conserved hypothetical protein [Neospora caninum Liverpool]|uniref:Uncharacterized protein n=1 Tax=Neospora caninum (strain Liverpool) TaxID=572307 RepID=F0VKB7_NEOCL|nr:conserved hypothetical protein [Neospora caninum Liverpool]CBZ54518.1 conserved hypothetical protein [Neospora caninum Liverpool]CEL69231.1 TPA: hypothetical protein BN1204_049470 [Neospora caninum Liverpool]|eukprot:XP_003884548.1 conserved hypothetical protein [Neospora caninum Liverpool]
MPSYAADRSSWPVAVPPPAVASSSSVSSSLSPPRSGSSLPPLSSQRPSVFSFASFMDGLLANLDSTGNSSSRECDERETVTSCVTRLSRPSRWRASVTGTDTALQPSLASISSTACATAPGARRERNASLSPPRSALAPHSARLASRPSQSTNPSSRHRRSVSPTVPPEDLRIESGSASPLESPFRALSRPRLEAPFDFFRGSRASRRASPPHRAFSPRASLSPHGLSSPRASRASSLASPSGYASARLLSFSAPHSPPRLRRLRSSSSAPASLGWPQRSDPGTVRSAAFISACRVFSEEQLRGSSAPLLPAETRRSTRSLHSSFGRRLSPYSPRPVPSASAPSVSLPAERGVNSFHVAPRSAPREERRRIHIEDTDFDEDASMESLSDSQYALRLFIPVDYPRLVNLARLFRGAFRGARTPSTACSSRSAQASPGDSHGDRPESRRGRGDSGGYAWGVARGPLGDEQNYALTFADPTGASARGDSDDDVGDDGDSSESERRRVRGGGEETLDTDVSFSGRWGREECLFERGREARTPSFAASPAPSSPGAHDTVSAVSAAIARLSWRGVGRGPCGEFEGNRRQRQAEDSATQEVPREPVAGRQAEPEGRFTPRTQMSVSGPVGDSGGTCRLLGRGSEEEGDGEGIRAGREEGKDAEGLRRQDLENSRDRGDCHAETATALDVPSPLSAFSSRDSLMDPRLSGVPPRLFRRENETREGEREAGREGNLSKGVLCGETVSTLDSGDVDPDHRSERNALASPLSRPHSSWEERRMSTEFASSHLESREPTSSEPEPPPQIDGPPNAAQNWTPPSRPWWSVPPAVSEESHDARYFWLLPRPSVALPVYPLSPVSSPSSHHPLPVPCPGASLPPNSNDAPETRPSFASSDSFSVQAHAQMPSQARASRSPSSFAAASAQPVLPALPSSLPASSSSSSSAHAPAAASLPRIYADAPSAYSQAVPLPYYYVPYSPLYVSSVIPEPVLSPLPDENTHLVPPAHSRLSADLSLPSFSHPSASLFSSSSSSPSSSSCLRPLLFQSTLPVPSSPPVSGGLSLVSFPSSVTLFHAGRERVFLDELESAFSRDSSGANPCLLALERSVSAPAQQTGLNDGDQPQSPRSCRGEREHGAREEREREREARRRWVLSTPSFFTPVLHSRHLASGCFSEEAETGGNDAASRLAPGLPASGREKEDAGARGARSGDTGDDRHTPADRGCLPHTGGARLPSLGTGEPSLLASREQVGARGEDQCHERGGIRGYRPCRALTSPWSCASPSPTPRRPPTPAFPSSPASTSVHPDGRRGSPVATAFRAERVNADSRLRREDRRGMPSARCPEGRGVAIRGSEVGEKDGEDGLRTEAERGGETERREDDVASVVQGADETQNGTERTSTGDSFAASKASANTVAMFPFILPVSPHSLPPCARPFPSSVVARPSASVPPFSPSSSSSVPSLSSLSPFPARRPSDEDGLRGDQPLLRPVETLAGAAASGDPSGASVEPSNGCGEARGEWREDGGGTGVRRSYGRSGDRRGEGRVSGIGNEGCEGLWSGGEESEDACDESHTGNEDGREADLEEESAGDNHRSGSRDELREGEQGHEEQEEEERPRDRGEGRARRVAEEDGRLSSREGRATGQVAAGRGARPPSGTREDRRIAAFEAGPSGVLICTTRELDRRVSDILRAAGVGQPDRSEVIGPCHASSREACREASWRSPSGLPLRFTRQDLSPLSLREGERDEEQPRGVETFCVAGPDGASRGSLSPPRLLFVGPNLNFEDSEDACASMSDGRGDTAALWPPRAPPVDAVALGRFLASRGDRGPAGRESPRALGERLFRRQGRSASPFPRDDLRGGPGARRLASDSEETSQRERETSSSGDASATSAFSSSDEEHLVVSVAASPHPFPSRRARRLRRRRLSESSLATSRSDESRPSSTRDVGPYATSHGWGAPADPEAGDGRGDVGALVAVLRNGIGGAWTSRASHFASREVRGASLGDEDEDGLNGFSFFASERLPADPPERVPPSELPTEATPGDARRASSRAPDPTIQRRRLSPRLLAALAPSFAVFPECEAHAHPLSALERQPERQPERPEVPRTGRSRSYAEVAAGVPPGPASAVSQLERLFGRQGLRRGRAGRQRTLVLTGPMASTARQLHLQSEEGQGAERETGALHATFSSSSRSACQMVVCLRQLATALAHLDSAYTQRGRSQRRGAESGKESGEEAGFAFSGESGRRVSRRSRTASSDSAFSVSSASHSSSRSAASSVSREEGGETPRGVRAGLCGLGLSAEEREREERAIEALRAYTRKLLFRWRCLLALKQAQAREKLVVEEREREEKTGEPSAVLRDFVADEGFSRLDVEDAKRRWQRKESRYARAEGKLAEKSLELLHLWGWPEAQ